MNEREKFEEWVMFFANPGSESELLNQANGGMNYEKSHVDLCWIAWQAATETAKPQWIKCSDRMPDIGLGVLVTDGELVGTANMSALPRKPFPTIYQVRSPNDGQRCLGDITHWMYIPSAPTL